MRAKNRRKKKKTFLILFFAIVIILLLNINRIIDTTYGMIVSIARPEEKTVQTANPYDKERYSVTESAPTIYAGTNYTFDRQGSNKTSTGEVAISYENFQRDINLVASNTGTLPWVKYGSISGINNNSAEKYRQRARQDATIEKWEVSAAGNSGENVSNVPSFIFPTTTNIFGKELNATAATTRTIAKYKYGNLKTNLNAGISYILAYERTVNSSNKQPTYDTDRVQQALWLFNRLGTSDAQNEAIQNAIEENRINEYLISILGEQLLGTNKDFAAKSLNLYLEAKAIQNFIDGRNKLKQDSGGQEMIDNMITTNENKYETQKAGLVSYSQDEEEYIVGPFSINYMREMFVPIKGAQSLAKNEDGTIIFGAISGAELWGVVDQGNGKYKEQALTNWEFVYTEVEYDTALKKAVRTHETKAIAEGDITKTIYPYPNETFYIKIKDSNVEALTKLKFKTKNMNAYSEVYELKGTYSNVSWVVSKDANGNFGLKSVVNSTKQTAANLYQIKSAKVVEEQKTISISLGYKQTNYDKIYKGICIPLTMTMSGKVWKDGTEVDEYVGGDVDGIIGKDSNGKTETGIKDVIVKLIDQSSGDEIQRTTTNSSGRYAFYHVKVGKRYIIEFEYDGMKYKSTKELGGYATVLNYKENMKEDHSMSHAKEESAERTAFNNDFCEITKDIALDSKGNKTRDVAYTYKRSQWSETNQNTGTGTIATVKQFSTTPVPQFSMTSSTKTAEIVYPLHDNYILTSLSNKSLQNTDKNQANFDKEEDMYYTIGKYQLNEHYYVTSSMEEPNIDNQFKTVLGHKYAKSHTYLQNINLGLIEREASDLSIQYDVTQTMFTLNEHVSDANIYDLGQKVETGMGFDISNRLGNYYEQTYKQEVNYDEYTWRYTNVDNKKTIENDELQLYIKYKITIKNQSQLLKTNITELVNYYDKELYYNNEIWRYYDKEHNYITDKKYNKKGYATIIMPQIATHTSWAIKNNGTTNEQEIGRVEWTTTSKYGEATNSTGLNRMYTQSLKSVELGAQEEIDVFIVFKVERTTKPREEGLYIANDNGDSGKVNIVEINGYRAKNYEGGTAGGRIDIDSNPGNTDYTDYTKYKSFKTYEDDTDKAPYLQVIANDKDNGRGISGYVWEDLRTYILDNKQIVGDGEMNKDDKGEVIEPFVNNVKVELVRMEYNKETGEYEEVSFAEDYEEKTGNQIVKYTGPQISGTSDYEITSGMYRFDNLIASGTYKIRFTYGTETQMKTLTNLGGNYENSVKYNGHDYKSTTYAGRIDLSTIAEPDTKIAIVVDTSPSISQTELSNVKNVVTKLQKDLKALHGGIQTRLISFAAGAAVHDDPREMEIKFGDNATEGIQLARNYVNAKNNNNEYAKNRIVIVVTDGFVNNKDIVRSQIMQILQTGASVIGVGLDGSIEEMFKVTAQYDGEPVRALYYNFVTNELEKKQHHTANKLYTIITDIMTNNLILVNAKSHASDYLQSQTILTETASKYVRGRLEVMQFSQKMGYDNAQTLNTDYINYLYEQENSSRDDSEWSQAVKKLAEKAQVTADSYIVNINFEDKMGVTKKVNLGLQEIPKSDLELEMQIDDITVTLANGEQLISLRKGITKNVQLIEGELYSIYLDEELMQGAKIDLTYRLTVSNIGEVDSLWSYLQYATIEEQRDFYEKLFYSLYGIEISAPESRDELDALLYDAIPIRVTRINSYYDNMVFRAEENNNWLILNKTVDLNGTTAKRNGLDDLIFKNDDIVNIDRNKIRQDTTSKWSMTDNQNILESIREQSEKYSTVQTTSFRDIELYPAISTAVADGAETSTLTTYLKLSKTLSAQDIDGMYSLQYKLFTEINTQESLNGRRDYNSQLANYTPGTDDTEHDSYQSEKVVILPPFGEKQFQYSLYITTSLILLSFIIIARRKK